MSKKDVMLSELDLLSHLIWRNGCPDRIVSELIETSHFIHLLSINFLQHFVVDAGIITMDHTVSAPKQLKSKFVVLLWRFCKVKTVNVEIFLICNVKLSITITPKYLFAKSPGKRAL